MQNSVLVELKKIVLLAFVSVLLFGAILFVAVSVQGCLIGDYPSQWRSQTEYAFLWMQPAVSGFDNFGIATYKDGILYAPSKGDNNVYAINASNGEIIWNKAVRWSDASPTIDGDVVYVGELVYEWDKIKYFPRAMALNKTTGEEIWHFVEPNDCGWVGSPLVHGDYVYYTTYFYPYWPIRYGSGVYALNKTNGNPIWHQNIGAAVCSVAYHNGEVFVSAYFPSSQYALNATTGDIVWHVSHARARLQWNLGRFRSQNCG